MAEEDELLSQDEIERLLQGSAPPAGTSPGQEGSSLDPGSGAGSAAVSSASAGPTAEPAGGSPGGVSSDQDQLGPRELDALLAGTQGKAPSPPPSPGAGTSLPPVKDADKLLRQAEIDNLLKEVQGQGAGATASPSKPGEPPTSPVGSSPLAESEINPRDIELLLNQAERALASVTEESTAALPPGITEFRLPEFSGAPASTDNATLDLLRDVELEVKIELGRTNMYLEEVLKLRRGSVVPLDKLAGDPVDIFVNGRLVARGEVLVLNDNFCVRVAELIAGVGPG